MGEKHSAVGYLFREGAFLPAQETKPVRNEFGLDLFQHRGSVYEGKTGLQFCSLQQAEDLAGFVEKHGGIEKVQKLIADSLERTGLSPRYTRPDEKKKDIFPPKEKDENRVFAKDLMGNKHYYYRFYNENGIELYTMEKKREFFQTVYIPCDGFMVGIDQRHGKAAISPQLSPPIPSNTAIAGALLPEIIFEQIPFVPSLFTGRDSPKHQKLSSLFARIFPVWQVYAHSI